MIVWTTHAKVGHCQAPLKQNAQPPGWAFCFSAFAGVAALRRCAVAPRSEHAFPRSKEFRDDLSSDVSAVFTFSTSAQLHYVGKRLNVINIMCVAHMMLATTHSVPRWSLL